MTDVVTTTIDTLVTHRSLMSHRSLSEASARGSLCWMLTAIPLPLFSVYSSHRLAFALLRICVLPGRSILLSRHRSCRWSAVVVERWWCGKIHLPLFLSWCASFYPKCSSFRVLPPQWLSNSHLHVKSESRVLQSSLSKAYLYRFSTASNRLSRFLLVRTELAGGCCRKWGEVLPW